MTSYGAYTYQMCQLTISIKPTLPSHDVERRVGLLAKQKQTEVMLAVLKYLNTIVVQYGSGPRLIEENRWNNLNLLLNLTSLSIK